MTALTPHGDHEYRNMVVRLPDLAVTSTELEDVTFSNCRIIGPAVIVPRGTEFVACSWETPDVISMFWEIDATRQALLGAIGLDRCMFSSCVFSLIGIAGPAELREQLESSLTPPE